MTDEADNKVKLRSSRLIMAEEQYQVMPILRELTGLSSAEIIRLAVHYFADKRHGTHFPLDGTPGGVPKRGTHKRKK